MSPVGDTLRNRCRNFPGVVNNTNIDWFFPWPEQALFAVACYAIDPKNPLVPPAYWEHVVTHVVTIHKSVEVESQVFQRKLRRDNYVTATNFMNYIKTYLFLLESKDQDLEAKRQRLSVGLDKLEDTAKQIKQLNAKLAEQKVIVEEKTISCERLMEEIKTSTEEANAKKKMAQEKSVEITQQSVVITKEKGEAEEALSLAMPALEAAKKALDELDKNDVTEIRAFATPPKPVQAVGELLCLVLQSGEISWKSARGLMADANFIKELQTLDVESIPLKNINAVKDTIVKKKLTMEDVRAASKAGAGFLKFITSILGFYDVAREIKPKRERVKMLEKELNKAKKELERLQEEVQRLEDQLKSLRKQFDDAQDEMERLNREMAIMQRQLLAAEKLTTGLASEKQRWISDVAGFQLERKNLLGDCLIASAFLSYLGPFTFEYRYNLIENIWLPSILSTSIPLSQNFKVQNLLTSDVEISKWNSQGLPLDELSIQNAILTTKASRFPVCIDPQEQAVKWIKKMEKNMRDESKSIKISNFNDPGFLRTLENGIKFGLPFLFEDCDDNIDPVIDNVLSKNIIQTKGRDFVMLGDREVDWEPPFKLYLTTKLSNPKFSPNLYSRANVINYTVTLSGLEGQLLSALVKNERRELEEKRESLIIETSENKRILKELEDKLLLELATQTGNILDNWELINTLEDTKAKAVEVAKQLSQSVIVSADIERQRDGYRPAAKRGAVLFFVLTNLSVINTMYQFSLGSYLVVFLKAIRKAMPDSSLIKRLNNIISTLTYHVYSYGCTGIFEKHKLLLSVQLAMRLEEDKGNIKHFEIDFFVKGNVNIGQKLPDKPFDWLPENSWKDLNQIATVMQRYGDILEHIGGNEELWKNWYMLQNPESEIPEYYSEPNKSFKKLCLLRCWRIDRIPTAITEFVSAVMGKEFVSPPITTFHAAFTSSTPTVPVVVIISPGSDPPAEIVKLANSIDFEVHKIKYLSMGQGQEKNALSLFDTAVSRGQWLMLQNAHLLIRFIPIIEKKLDDLVKPHPDFRLWLTTEPVSTFPVGILQKSYKIVMEPPSGVKQNLLGTYAKIPNDSFLDSPHPKYRQCIFPLAFLHAILQERRRFGKIGWNIPYDFAESDFQVSLKILQTYLTKAHEKKQASIPWSTIKYLIGEVMYGGRAIDSFDRRILKTYMNEYFGDFLFDEFQLFHFYEDDFVEYYIPEEPEECSSLKEIYIDYIKTLPHDQSPRVFGLHENALIGYSTNFTKELWQNMIELQPQTEDETGESGETGSKEKIIGDIVVGILKRLPSLYDTIKIKKNLLIGTSDLSPTAVVLLQELDRFNLLLRKMFSTLTVLQKALIGEAGMSNELDDISKSLANGQLPFSWRILAPETMKMLGSWLEHLHHRRKQYDDWVDAGKVDLAVMWLSGLHLPESYLTALIQKACRRNQWALDGCTLATLVTKIEPGSPESGTLTPEFGCYAIGFYLEGCGWDIENGCVMPQKSRQLIQSMPVIQLHPIEAHKYKTTNTIKVPVYVTSQRRNAMGVGLVTELDLTTSEHQSHWILQGIALTLNSDD